MKHALKALVVCALFYAHGALAATTLLPPGMQCFTDANGAVVSGSINMYTPATTTKKNTWQDSGQVTLNSNPIQLDANGCATIFGVGQYRQQLYDGPVVAGATTGNLIFDKLTTDTSAFNSVFWAALSGGTPNTITITDTGFNATDGSQINFVALGTNTGATTLNPSGFGAISIVKDTTGGPVALTGGEITANNVISVVYYSSSNTFHLVNSVIQSASGATSPLCGATGLNITNNGVTPNTIINLTANQAVTQNAAGLVINRSSISLTAINTSTGNVTSTANGMDGEAPGVSQWLYIWLIDSGSAAAGLVSTSSTAPTLPSGYPYKCLMGAMQVDSSGNLFRTVQLGSGVSYKLVASSNTTVPFAVANGAGASTYSITNPVLVAATVRGNTFCAPSIASSVKIVASNQWKGGAIAQVLVAPNTAWGGTNNGPEGSNGVTYPIWFSTAGANTPISAFADIQLEGDTIAYAGSAAGTQIACMGFKLPVNAN